jgi:hypothetical protein
MPAIAPDIPVAEAAIIEMTNSVRSRENLSPVAANPALTIAARAFAAYLAKAKAFSHTADGKEPADRATAAGYVHCQIAENLALSADSRGFEARALAKQTIEGWLNSPGHRANMLAPYVTEIGVAIARVPDKDPKYVMVEMVGRPMALATEFQVSNATKEPVRYSLAGDAQTLEPGMGITHTICQPKALQFEKAGTKPLANHFDAANGKVYTVRQKGGAVTVEVTARDTVK